MNISVSGFGAELRVVIIRSRARYFPLGHECFRRLAECAATAVLMVGSGIFAQGVQVLASKAILSRSRRYNQLFFLFGRLDLVARAVVELGKDVSAAGIERFYGFVVRWSWIFGV